jgi:hypothetical protein
MTRTFSKAEIDAIIKPIEKPVHLFHQPFDGVERFLGRMNHYHGTPISGTNQVAETALAGGRAFISHRRRDHLQIAIDHCVGFSVDNGAFSAWRSGQPITDWQTYYNWVSDLQQHSAFDWAIIPDVIDGTESDNDHLLAQWPADLKSVGVPVWHMHESIDRFARLCDRFDRVAIGSSGQFAHPCTKPWWQRMHAAMDAVCDSQGLPPCLLHGLRMLNQAIVSVVPLDSADSTTLAINVGFDKNSTIKCRHERALFLRARIESIRAVSRYERPRQMDMWGAA